MLISLFIDWNYSCHLSQSGKIHSKNFTEFWINGLICPYFWQIYRLSYHTHSLRRFSDHLLYGFLTNIKYAVVLTQSKYKISQYCGYLDFQLWLKLQKFSNKKKITRGIQEEWWAVVYWISLTSLKIVKCQM
jgi:hypothetical protein